MSIWAMIAPSWLHFGLVSLTWSALLHICKSQTSKRWHRILHRSEQCGQCRCPCGNAANSGGRTVGTTGWSCTSRTPDKLDKDKDSASRGTTSVPADSPGGSRECRFGERLRVPRLADIPWRRKWDWDIATHWNRKGLLLPPREEYLEVSEHLLKLTWTVCLCPNSFPHNKTAKMFDAKVCGMISQFICCTEMSPVTSLLISDSTDILFSVSLLSMYIRQQ